MFFIDVELLQSAPLYKHECHFVLGISQSNFCIFHLPTELVLYSPKKETHNILVYRQVQIIVTVTCVLYVNYVIEYKEYNFEGFW